MNNIKILLSILISISLVFPAASAIPITKPEDKTIMPPLFSFNSYIDIKYDPELLNKELPINKAVNMPITFSYWTDIPENFLRFAPWQIRNIILFGSMITPMQIIYLDVVNTPDWATIYFSEPELFVGFPTEENIREISTSLIIMIHDDAPAETYLLRLKAETYSLKRINGFSYQESIDFTPIYRPIISIGPLDNTIMTPPNQISFVPINITNEGNAKTRVTSEIVSELAGWSASIIPSQVILSIDETEQMTLVLMPPQYFEGIQQIELSFIPSRYPIAEPDEVGTPLNVSIMTYYLPR